MYISDQTRMEMEAGAARLESVKRLQQEVQAVNAIEVEPTQPVEKVVIEQPAPEKPSVVVAPVVVADMPPVTSGAAPPVVAEQPPAPVTMPIPEPVPMPMPTPMPMPELVKLAEPEPVPAETDTGKRRPRTKVDVEPITAPPQPVTQ